MVTAIKYQHLNGNLVADVPSHVFEILPTANKWLVNTTSQSMVVVLQFHKEFRRLADR